MRTPGNGITPGPGPAPGPGPTLALLGAAWLFLLLLPAPALAHGAELTCGMGQAAWIKATYADGEPMEFAKVKVLDPHGRTHQVGNADALGRFAWLADQAGEWKAVAQDGMGHRGEAALVVGQAEAAGSAQAPPQPQPLEDVRDQPLWARAAWGLSFIFWLSGLAFWRQGRRR